MKEKRCMDHLAISETLVFAVRRYAVTLAEPCISVPGRQCCCRVFLCSGLLVSPSATLVTRLMGVA